MDIAARRKAAGEEAARIRATANGCRVELGQLEAELRALKRKPESKSKSDALRQAIRDQEKAIREIEARGQEVEDAVFDLKAVNPNAKSPEDARSSIEILSLVESKGREVQEAVERLRALLRPV
ncbi:MAG: hypothetical protein HY735_14170 [Verrucomicrobia bacterium]|nr:hypothetical protein [Verrucomicrobiota bacterium]